MSQQYNQPNNQYNQPPQQPAYSNEQQMPTGQGIQSNPLNTEGITKVECILDTNSLKILQEAHPEFAESIINLGIKMVGESDVYKSYMIRDEFKKQDSKQDKVSNENKTTLSLNDTQTNKIINDSVPAKPTKTAGFAAW